MSNDPFGFCAEPQCDDTVPSQLPSFKDMMKNLAGTMKDVAVGAVQGQGVFVDEPTYERRMSLCHGCEFFIQDDKRCTKCGCFMEAKTRLKKAFCPVHKWEAMND